MLTDLFIFAAALYTVIHSSTFATRYASRLASGYRLSQYTVGFIVVAIISILPETFISLNAAFEHVPSLGLGVLLGSNVADLTIVFALIAFLARRPIKIEQKILNSHVLYPFLLLLPIILGLDGYLGRTEGLALIVAGCVFYYLALRNGSSDGVVHAETKRERTLTLMKLVASMAALLIGAHFTVTSATDLAHIFGVSPVLIGMLVVGIGTTMPEFFFSLRAVRAHDDSLAVGDILGTVLADATIVIGILSLISPFAFPKIIIYVAGVFMVAAAFILFIFMRSGRMLTRRESLALVVFWLTFVLIEFIVNTTHN